MFSFAIEDSFTSFPVFLLPWSAMLTCFIGSVAPPAEVFCSDMMGWVSFWVSCEDGPGEQNLLLSCRGAPHQTGRTASHISLAETKLQLSNVSQII